MVYEVQQTARWAWAHALLLVEGMGLSLAVVLWCTRGVVPAVRTRLERLKTAGKAAAKEAFDDERLRGADMEAAGMAADRARVSAALGLLRGLEAWLLAPLLHFGILGASSVPRQQLQPSLPLDFWSLSSRATCGDGRFGSPSREWVRLESSSPSPPGTRGSPTGTKGRVLISTHAGASMAMEHQRHEPTVGTDTTMPPDLPRLSGSQSAHSGQKKLSAEDMDEMPPLSDERRPPRGRATPAERPPTTRRVLSRRAEGTDRRPPRSGSPVWPPSTALPDPETYQPANELPQSSAPLDEAAPVTRAVKQWPPGRSQRSRKSRTSSARRVQLYDV